VAALLAGAALGGCGSSGSRVASPSGTPAPAAPAPAAANAALAPTRVAIISPLPGARTGSTLTVHVRLSGARPAGAPVLRYLLDGTLSRRGSTALTLRNLAPGGHRLVVMLAADPGVLASSRFTVRSPKPAAAVPAAPGAAPPAQSQPLTPPASNTTRTSTPTPAPAPTAPAHTVETPPAPPASTPAPSPPAAGAIPQGGGGDGDADNNGGPSDGDGNI